MSKVYDEIIKGPVGCKVCGAPDEATWEKMLYHIRSLEAILKKIRNDPMLTLRVQQVWEIDELLE